MLRVHHGVPCEGEISERPGSIRAAHQRCLASTDTLLCVYGRHVSTHADDDSPNLLRFVFPLHFACDVPRRCGLAGGRRGLAGGHAWASYYEAHFVLEPLPLELERATSNHTGSYDTCGGKRVVCVRASNTLGSCAAAVAEPSPGRPSAATGGGRERPACRCLLCGVSTACLATYIGVVLR
eukprot:364276-Chlamydomonas_euryale.AAC.5